MNYEVIIIGAGVAGLSAALWCDDLKIDALVLEQSDEIGGQLLWTFNPIYNYLGALAENGRELRDKFASQLSERSLNIKFAVEIATVNPVEKIVTLKNGETLSAKFLILATGIRRRKLGIEGEEEFSGKGILTSGKRDGETVRGKEVLVVGGGDAACENALILAEFAEKVWLVHRRREFRARREFLAAIKQNPKIQVLTETNVRKISGKETIERVELRREDAETSFQIAVQAVIFRLGVTPNNELFHGQAECDENGYLKINQRCETNIENVFAVGDVANPLAPTVSTAIGNGATAVKVISTRI